jgi:phosphonate degradation associated HDIG domain protein
MFTWRVSKQSIFDEVRSLFETAKAQEYLGEDITLIEHMVQCGDLAKSDRAPDWLVVAALLHDVGHILIPDAQEAQDAGSDRHHDEVGASWLTQRFPNNVVQAVKLHVDAKKYLVATNPEYFDKLSAASKATLLIQGGAFSPRECEDFLRQDFADEAVQLRLWDDTAKVRGISDASLDRFRDAIEKVASQG